MTPKSNKEDTITYFKIAAALTLVGTVAMADHPYANGEENSGGVARFAADQGALHPGHVAVLATGKDTDDDGVRNPGRYNNPTADFHLDGTPYPTGPIGYATTRGNK